ncbi:MAG: tRNA1(Val) (adenine(37)-N6)-methyltransferase [Oscillospiraceae bacterium]|jgi:tRNA1Val (adenine37-N6)-methyltransferase
MRTDRWPNGCKFLQTPRQFALTTDSVLLAGFAGEKRARLAADLGCGIGGIAILMCERSAQLRVDCIEIQPEAAYLASENVKLNGMDSRIRIIEGDLRRSELLPSDTYDLVVCNPPYFSAGTGKPPKTPTIERARSDTDCTIEDCCIAAARLLKTGGRFCVCFRAERLVDLFCAMRSSGIEPKRLRYVRDKLGSKSNIVLTEGVKGAGVQLTHEPDLIIRCEDGSYTDEVKRIYGI